MSRFPALVLVLAVSCKRDAPVQAVRSEEAAVQPPEARTDDTVAPVNPPPTPTGMVRIAGGPGPQGRYRGRAVRYAFFIDVLETTVGEYAQCVAAGACTPAWDGQGSYETACTVGKDEKLPINCVNIEQARAYCGWRGKRLLVDHQWHWAARGESRPTPWGTMELDCEHSNTSRGTPAACGFAGPWPVGHAPAGATPQGVMDLLGNVAEFVEMGRGSPFTRIQGRSAGGSWDSKLEESDPLWSPFGVGGAHRNDRIGIRCGADAVVEPKAPPAMAFHYEGGTVEVREEKTRIDEPFFLDTFEATVEEYAACVESGACTPAHASTKEQQCTADTAGPAKRPINCITQAQAEAFCRAEGKRLPTAAQWQWAMQSMEQENNFPWGQDRTRRCTVANVRMEKEEPGCGFGGPWPVVQGSLGDTLAGVHDMIGNVGEWTSSAGDAPDERLHAGRGWKATLEDLRYRLALDRGNVEDRPGTIIASAKAESWSDQIGVRCLQDAPPAIE